MIDKMSRQDYVFLSWRLCGFLFADVFIRICEYLCEFCPAEILVHQNVLVNVYLSLAKSFDTNVVT